ncbi:PAS domain-containing protein [Methanolacinia petrolearia]|uniref:PAS domain-containing protein n=1 Tax=Methanolacinia petrolearia TaxID=54120 RepID=UPI003BAC3DC8
MTVTYVAVGISIAMISKTNNENKNILIGSISNYENFFEEIQDAILVYNSSGDILGVNNAASRLFGLEKKYLTFLKIEDLGNFIEKDDLKKAFYDISPSKSGFTDTRLKQQDGNTIYVEILSSVVDPSKGIMRAYIRDVTSRVVAEEKIHDSEARYRYLINQLPEMIFELDIDGNLAL